MAKALTTDEIKHRLTRLRNFENNLYPAARARIEKLEARVNVLDGEKLLANEREAQFLSLTQKLQLQVEMLNAKVFGKKRGKQNGESSNGQGAPSADDKPPKQSRSYRRAVPDEAEVTGTMQHPLDNSDSSPHAGHILSKHKAIDYFEEDVILPSEVSLKTVTKHSVAAAYCQDCATWIY